MWAVGIAKAVLPPQVKIYALDIEVIVVRY